MMKRTTRLNLAIGAVGLALIGLVIELTQHEYPKIAELFSFMVAGLILLSFIYKAKDR